MLEQKKSLIRLVFVNIMVACFVQVICSSILSEKMDMSLFQFIIFQLGVCPVTLVLINSAMALKFSLKFHQYSVSAYLGFLCSIVLFAFIVLIIERPQELPPGEIVLGADLVFIIFIFVVQFVTLLFLNLVTYMIYKAYKLNEIRRTCTLKNR